MIRPLCNQRGNMSTLAVFTLIGVIAGSMLIYYFFGAFITKRQSQNVSDAAALAAAQVLRDKYEQRMVLEAEEKVRELLSRLQEQLAQQAAPLPSLPPVAVPAPTHPRKTLKDLLRETGIGTELLKKLENGTFDPAKDWVLVVKDPVFGFDDRVNGQILRRVYRDNIRFIKDAAEDIIYRNGGTTRGAELHFPVDNEPKLTLKAAATMRVDKLGIREDLMSAASAGLNADEIGFDMSGYEEPAIYW